MLSRAVAACTRQRLPSLGAPHAQRVSQWLNSRQLGLEIVTSQQASSHLVRGVATARLARDAATAGSAPVAAEDTKKDEKAKEKEKEDEDKPLSWTKLFLYIASGMSGLVFLYYYRKANYSLHATEVLMLERWRSFPLYYPPEARDGKRNGSLDGRSLPPELVVAFAEWFIQTDLQEAGGVVRDDVLELFKELGLDDGTQASKDFLMRGDGQLEEHRRLTGAGLQESVSLLSKMAMPEDGSPCLVGEAGLTLLREKLPQKAPSLMGGAMALMQGGAVAAASGSAAVQQTAASLASPVKEAMISSIPQKPAVPVAPVVELSEGSFDDAEMKRMEDQRLARIEEGLLKRLNKYGALSPGEEARLHNVREQRTKL